MVKSLCLSFVGNAIQVTSLYSVGCCDLKFFRGGGDTFLWLCCQLGTNSIQKQVKKGKCPRTFRIVAIIDGNKASLLH